MAQTRAQGFPGSEHGAGIKNPDTYEALKREGHTKSSAAAISNAALNKGYKMGHHRSGDEGPGTEELSPEGSGFANDIEQRTCDMPEFDQMSGMPQAGMSMSSTGASSSTAPPVVGDDEGDIGILPLKPDPMFNHPQQYPGGSTPPEPTLEGGASDKKGSYGGVAGGLSEWGKDCFDDVAAPAPPTPDPRQSPGIPEISADEIYQQSKRYWSQME